MPSSRTDRRTWVALDVAYLSAEWYAARRAGIAASEIAAVVGLSPWTSPFDLWWQKQTGEDSQAENRAMRRGRRYEALVLEDFAEEHPDLDVRPSITIRSTARPWQIATPDALAYAAPNDPAGQPLAVVEAKTGQRRDWGAPGTDQVPLYYRAQVLWQMDILGVDVAYVPVLFGDTFAEYVVPYDAADAQILRDAAARFLDSLDAGEQPDIDAHTATSRRLKHLHPSLVDGEVEIPAAWVAQFHTARHLRDAAQARMQLAENRVRHALGPHASAVTAGRKTASRTVYDVKPRTQQVKGYTVNRLNFTKPPTEETRPA